MFCCTSCDTRYRWRPLGNLRLATRSSRSHRITQSSILNIYIGLWSLVLVGSPSSVPVNVDVCRTRRKGVVDEQGWEVRWRCSNFGGRQSEPKCSVDFESGYHQQCIVLVIQWSTHCSFVCVGLDETHQEEVCHMCVCVFICGCLGSADAQRKPHHNGGQHFRSLYFGPRRQLSSSSIRSFIHNDINSVISFMVVLHKSTPENFVQQILCQCKLNSKRTHLKCDVICCLREEVLCAAQRREGGTPGRHRGC